MRDKNILKEIRGVFKKPKKHYYIGEIVHGTPYFPPIGFCSSIIKIRRLKLKTEEQLEKYDKDFPHLKGKGGPEFKFSNMPMVRRSKNWIKRIFGSYYWIQIGWPIVIRKQGLGWKDKWNSPRHEWSPAFYIFFFKWQLCVWWLSPCGEREEKYWEMILWWLYYSDKDIKKAEETWGWEDVQTKLSTWNKNYLL